MDAALQVTRAMYQMTLADHAMAAKYQHCRMYTLPRLSPTEQGHRSPHRPGRCMHFAAPQQTLAPSLS